jgi:hypothetical protein
MIDMPEAIAAAPPALNGTTVFKQCNVTIVAEGLQTSVLDAQLFPELGAPVKALQIPSLALLGYEKYSFWVEPENRRAVALDTTGQLTDRSPIVGLMEKYLEKVPGVNIAALGLNFFFEIVFQNPSVNFMLEKFLRGDALSKLGSGAAVSAGFKVIHREKGYLRQLAVDPLWKNEKGVSVLVNYHVDAPTDPARGLRLVERFAECVASAPILVREIANV